MIKEITYQSESYSRQTNPPSEPDTIVRWKIGSFRLYDQISNGSWYKWKLSGRWKNDWKCEPCEEPEIEKYYKELHESI